MQQEIKDFWQTHPCGAGLVGDLNDRSRREYQEFFDRYDKFRYQKEPHILTNLDRFDFRGQRLLEIGLGQGADAEQLVRRGAIYSGVDLTDESVERVRTRFELKGLEFDRIERASVLELPFADNSFDIVFSHGVLHHVPDIEKAQAEIARVLRSDGRLIMMLYAKRSLNYLLSISLLRRAGLFAMHSLGIKAGGIYGQHLENAREMGIGKYLAMSNFINVSTDGAYNPYSKVYDLAEVERDFPDLEIVNSSQHFMHAPPLPVNALPLAGMLGWHLWVTMRPRKGVA